MTPASMMRARGITWRLVVLAAAVLGTMILLGQSLRIYFVQAGQIAEAVSYTHLRAHRDS